MAGASTPRSYRNWEGLGLLGMRERASLAGGELEVDSEVGQGTRVYFEVALAGPMKGSPMIKVLLADDHDLVRAGLRHIVEDSGDMEVVAEAADGREAIQQALQKTPDVAVIDISMPGMDGLEVISQLRSHYPKLPILILTMHTEEQFVVRAVEAGAMGYLTKRAAPGQLVHAIRKLHAGGRYLSDAAADALALRLVKGAPGQSLLDSLSNQRAPGLAGAGPGADQPGDRRGLRHQHQDRQYLPGPPAQETQSQK